MEPELHNFEGRENTKEKHPVLRVTTFSKYFALLLFIVMPFVGGYIGFGLASKANPPLPVVIQVETPEERSEILEANSSISTKAEEVPTFPAAGNKKLTLPTGWNIEVAQQTGGGAIAITNHYIYDDNNKLVATLNYPIREVGYHGSSIKNRRSMVLLDSSNEIETADFVLEDGSTGFTRFSYSGSNFWEESYEIFVPYRKSSYVITKGEVQTSREVETRYKSYGEYNDERDFIETVLIQGISESNE